MKPQFLETQGQDPVTAANNSFSRPNWPLLLDSFSLVSLTLTFSAIVFGGVRFNYFGVRIFSATSVTRLIVVTGTFVAVRQLLFCHDPIHRRVARWITNLRRSQAIQAVCPAFFVSRLGVLTVGFLSVLVVGYDGGAPPFRVSQNEVVNLPARWDAGWYAGIASDGYEGSPRLDRQQDIAFFPAYPVLMRAAGDLLGADLTRPYVVGVEIVDTKEGRLLWGGVATSLVAFFIALLYVYRLARDDFGEQVAHGSVVLLATYPFAVFFSAPYAESLFLLGIVAAFYHFRRGDYTVAGAWGLLVGLTKPNGFLLGVPLFLVWLPTATGLLRQSSPTTPTGRANPSSVVGLIAMAMPGVGMLLFSTYLYGLTGEPLAWLEVHQQGWNREFGSLGTLLLERYHLVAEQGIYVYASRRPVELFNGLAALLALALVWPVARRLGISYASFLVIIVVPALMAGGFLSIGRFTSVLFPMFIYLALVLPRRWHVPVAFFAAQLQALLAVTFYTWRPPY